MEISVEELQQLFSRHREMMYRWSLRPDTTTQYPRSIDVSIKDGAILSVKESIGPKDGRQIEIPLGSLFDIWPLIERAIISQQK